MLIGQSEIRPVTNMPFFNPKFSKIVRLRISNELDKVRNHPMKIPQKCYL